VCRQNSCLPTPSVKFMLQPGVVMCARMVANVGFDIGARRSGWCTSIIVARGTLLPCVDSLGQLGGYVHCMAAVTGVRGEILCVSAAAS
jgi:hypothetical protein